MHARASPPPPALTCPLPPSVHLPVASRQELLEDPEQVQLFVKEVSLLRKLRHK